MPMSWSEFSCPYKWGTRDAKEWYRMQNLKAREYTKAKKAAVKAKLAKYKEARQLFHDKKIDWNTYCRLTKRYYQSPSTLAAYGVN